MKAFLCSTKTGSINEYFCKTLSEICDCTRPVLYATFAMRFDECEENFKKAKRQLSLYGFDDVQMIKNASELNQIDLSEYAFIYIADGNVYKLLFELKMSGSFEKLKRYIQNDGIVFAEAAGSKLFGRDIKICSNFMDNYVGLIDTRGFDLLNGII